MAIESAKVPLAEPLAAVAMGGGAALLCALALGFMVTGARTIAHLTSSGRKAPEKAPGRVPGAG